MRLWVGFPEKPFICQRASSPLGSTILHKQNHEV
jgi:hypothetical protein